MVIITPPSELDPLTDVEHVALLLARNILGVTGCTFKRGDMPWTGAEWIICDTDSDYIEALRLGLERKNGRVITRANLYKLAVEKSHNMQPIE